MDLGHLVLWLQSRETQGLILWEKLGVTHLEELGPSPLSQPHHQMLNEEGFPGLSEDLESCPFLLLACYMAVGGTLNPSLASLFLGWNNEG